MNTWLRRALVVAGAPFFARCGGCCGALGGFPSEKDVAWDGLLIDGGLPPTSGPLDFETCEGLCTNTGDCTPTDMGHVRCTVICRGGRAPPGMRTISDVDAFAGSWLSRMAEFEAAAVIAFHHLADELDAHGIIDHARYARAAAAEEVSHAVEMTRLSLRFGYCPVAPRVDATPLRALEDIALDNAAEGCGRELFGALLNQHQAEHATDPAVRATMARIAVDERAHAELSRSLADVLMPRLTLAQRGRAREAQQVAFERLSDEDVPETVRRQLGLMDPQQLRSAAKTLLDTARL
jgi:hypothetical protein